MNIDCGRERPDIGGGMEDAAAMGVACIRDPDGVADGCRLWGLGGGPMFDVLLGSEVSTRG